MKCSIEDIKQDLDGDRSLVKSLFKQIFEQYGICLDDKMLNNIFGRIQLKKGNYDTILFFVKGTHFNFSLRYQFEETVNGQANGLFSAFFMRAAGELGQFGNDPVFDYDNVETNENKWYDNPFLYEKRVITILATAAACTH